jgi:DNA-directed RNA polymerase specialized sigma subunit
VLAELWTSCKQHGAKDARERLILHYSPLVKFVDWVRRSVRAKARAIERAYSKLENELRRTPTTRRSRPSST